MNTFNGLSKFQKILFSVFILASLIAAYFGYSYLKQNKQPSVKAITLIPDSCKVMMVFDHYADFSNSLRHKNLLWQDLNTLPGLYKFEKHLAYFDSLLNVNEELNELVGENKIYFASYPDNSFLVALNVKELAEQNTLREKLTSLFPASLFVNVKAQIHDGVVGISNSENTLAKLFSKNAKLIQNKNFLRLNEAAEYTGTSIYLENNSLFNNSFSSITLKPESISLNGISIADSSMFVGDVTTKPLSSYEMLEHVPLVCNAFDLFAVGNAEKLFSSSQAKDWWLQVNELALFNAKKQFYDNLEAYGATLLLPSKNKALIFGVSDTSRIEEILPYMKDTSFKHPRIIKLAENSASFVKSTFQKLNLKELNYLLLFNDRIVLTSSQADAELFINADQLNSSLMDNTSFKNYAGKNFDTEFHLLRYVMVNTLSPDEMPFGNLIKPGNESSLKNISHFSQTSTSKNNFITSRLNVKYFQEDISSEPNLLWTLNTDSSIITFPYTFRNHITKGTEIAFQASDNSLYLQNATGKTLWKKKINEEIRSEIFTVDAFKNQKYQLLFNTDNYIHLIDRNGNYVQGYPVKLPARATNKLCVLDYEGKNDLRLFIACSNNKIYNYSIWGQIHEGFKPYVTSGEVILPVRYCKVGLSDYLVTADRKGKIYAFSRKGEGRIDFKNKLVEDIDNFEIECGNSLSATQILYYDQTNHLIEKISLTDKKEIYKTDEGDGKTICNFGDFDKNSITDMLLVSTKSIEVYDINGSQIFAIKLPSEIDPQTISLYQKESVTILTAFDGVSGNTFLYNSEQKTTKNYTSSQPPLLFDLFNDGKTYVIVADGKKLKCYRL